jgi:5,10-methylenetetrahydromethanopterin reductase
MGVELWTSAKAMPGASPAVRFEDAGWDGVTFTESPNRAGDPYVALTVAALSTRRIRLGIGVTNPLTRHPAVTAAAIASVQVESGGRASLGVGRGDPVMAHLGLRPAPLPVLRSYVWCVRAYLRGEAVPPNASPPVATRLRWLDGVPPAQTAPVFVVASGPKAIAVAAGCADRVALAVGADPQRVRRAVELARSVRADIAISAYVNVTVDDDRDRARQVSAARVATFARFSGGFAGGLSGDFSGTAAGPGRTGTRSAHPVARRGRTALLTREFVDRFAVLGSAPYCVDRLLELADLGIDRFHVVGPEAPYARAARRRFVADVMPRLHALA